MKAFLGVLLVFLGACSHIELTAKSDSRVPASSAGASVQIQTGRGFAALVVGGMLIAGAAEDVRNPHAAPTLDPNREITEQDCTKPIELGANLRCR